MISEPPVFSKRTWEELTPWERLQLFRLALSEWAAKRFSGRRTGHWRKVLPYQRQMAKIGVTVRSDGCYVRDFRIPYLLDKAGLRRFRQDLRPEPVPEWGFGRAYRECIQT